LIDDDRVLSIEPGETVRVALEIGHHEVSATTGWMGSQLLGIEVEPETAYPLIVAQNRKFYLPWMIAVPINAVGVRPSLKFN
jgi:hypothetical protein